MSKKNLARHGNLGVKGVVTDDKTINVNGIDVCFPHHDHSVGNVVFIDDFHVSNKSGRLFANKIYDSVTKVIPMPDCTTKETIEADQKRAAKEAEFISAAKEMKVQEIGDSSDITRLISKAKTLKLCEGQTRSMKDLEKSLGL